MVYFRVAFPSLKAAVTDCFHQRFNIFTFPFVAADLHFVFLLFLLSEQQQELRLYGLPLIHLVIIIIALFRIKMIIYTTQQWTGGRWLNVRLVIH